MLESEFVAVISATAPLNLMTHVFEDIYFHMLEDISKAGGERGAVDTDATEVKRMFEWQYIRRNCSLCSDFDLTEEGQELQFESE